MNIEENI